MIPPLVFIYALIGLVENEILQNSRIDQLEYLLQELQNSIIAFNETCGKYIK